MLIIYLVILTLFNLLYNAVILWLIISKQIFIILIIVAVFVLIKYLFFTNGMVLNLYKMLIHNINLTFVSSLRC